MNFELKPCPFCGDRAVLNDAPYADDNTHVFCINCEAMTKEFVIGIDGEGYGRAAEAWNKRCK